MKIHLISHACVIIESADTAIWTDPWLFGKAFNDSWTLFPQASWDQAWLDRIDHIWISHEHPDHFHVPTLKSLPDKFKKRVVVLFHKDNSTKMFDAFERLGFPNKLALPHRETLGLTDKTRVYCYQQGQMNSCLAVLSGGQSILNINDAEIFSRDCRLITRDVGNVDIILNQFSIAGYSGLPDRETRLRDFAGKILKNISDNHRELGAKVTIPFASFIYFSASDNSYINQYANRPNDVFDYLKARGQEAVVLYPGDAYEVNLPHDSGPVLERFQRLYGSLASQHFDPPNAVAAGEIIRAFAACSKSLHKTYPKALFYLLKPFVAEIPDLNVKLRFCLKNAAVSEVESQEAADLIVNSQPLHFAFSQPYGFQTLGVSARLEVRRNFRNWQLHRILFALNNAELYLRPRYLLRGDNLSYFSRRFEGGFSNLWQRLRLMRYG